MDSIVLPSFTNVFSWQAMERTVGIAYIASLCYENHGDRLLRDHARHNPALDTRVVAHETGHIFGSKHTHGAIGPGEQSAQPRRRGSCFSGTSKPSGPS